VVVSGWLVDKSALFRLGSSSTNLGPIESSGTRQISTVTLLEVISARSADDRQ
jgi:hypothetical protein